jgi:hypothetical protein
MTILRFELTEETDREAAETDLSIAVFAAECVYGQARLRLEMSYALDDNGKICVIRSAGEAGEAAARIFAGLTAARLGEAAYAVRVLEKGSQP